MKTIGILGRQKQRSYLRRRQTLSYLPSDPEKIEQSMGKLISGLKTQPRGLMFDEVTQRSNRRDNNLRDAINWKAENGRVPSKAPEVDANGSLVRKVPLTAGAMDVDGSVARSCYPIMEAVKRY